MGEEYWRGQAERIPQSAMNLQGLEVFQNILHITYDMKHLTSQYPAVIIMMMLLGFLYYKRDEARVHCRLNNIRQPHINSTR